MATPAHKTLGQAGRENSFQQSWRTTQKDVGDFASKVENVSGTAYTYIEDQIDSLLPPWTRIGAFFDKHLFSFSAAQSVSIRDPVLGMLMALFKLVIVLYVCIEIFYNRKYNYEEVPQGYPSHISFERGTFNSERKLWSQAGGGYCSSENIDKYEYLAVIRDESDVVSPILNAAGTYVRAPDPVGNSARNDDKVACQQFHFAEITKVSSDAAYLMTFQKETYSTVVGHDNVLVDCTNTAVRKGSDVTTTVILPKTPEALAENRNYFKTEEYVDGNGNIIESKTCLEMKNSLAVAPEFVDLSFDHTYITSDRVMEGNGATGSSASSKTKGSRHPHTHVMTSPKHPTNPNEYVDVSKLTERPKFTLVYLGTERDERSQISAGEKVTIPVSALLALAGISLDDPATENVAPRRTGQPAPPRRLTGVQLVLELKYSVRTYGVYTSGEATADCDLIVQHQDGIVAWTADAQMHVGARFDDLENKRVYSELLRRGIQIRFRATGKVIEFNLYQLINLFIQALVLLPYASQLVIVMATSLVPKKDIYSNKMTENVNFHREVTKFAGSMLQYGELFRQIKAQTSKDDETLTGSEQTLTEDELTDFFLSTTDGDEGKARKLAKQMMIAVITDEKTGIPRDISRERLTKSQFVDLLAEDTCTTDQMESYLNSAYSSGAVSQERLLDRIRKQTAGEHAFQSQKKEEKEAKEKRRSLANFSREAKSPVPLETVEEELTGDGVWKCPSCTFSNPTDEDTCHLCGGGHVA